MRAPKVHTGNMTQARKFADIALAENRTTHVDVLAERFGSLEACKTYAVGIQRSFCSMRVVERNKRANKLKHATEAAQATLITSEYDKLACHTLAIPEGRGYRVVFEPTDDLMSLLEVSFEDGSKPDPVNTEMLALEARIIRDITSVTLDELFRWCEKTKLAGKDIINDYIGPMAANQKREDWLQTVAIPAWRKRYGASEPQADASEPQTEKTAIDEQLDALGEDMWATPSE